MLTTRDFSAYPSSLYPTLTRRFSHTVFPTDYGSRFSFCIQPFLSIRANANLWNKWLPFVPLLLEVILAITIGGSVLASGKPGNPITRTPELSLAQPMESNDLAHCHNCIFTCQSPKRLYRVSIRPTLKPAYPRPNLWTLRLRRSRASYTKEMANR